MQVRERITEDLGNVKRPEEEITEGVIQETLEPAPDLSAPEPPATPEITIEVSTAAVVPVAQETTEPEPPEEPQPPAKRSRFWLYAFVLAVFLLAGGLWSVGLPWFFGSATITITPSQKENTATLTIQTVALAPLSMSQSKTVAATGAGYQPAAQAHGLIVLYNAALSPQTIEAGTLLTGHNGITVTTDATVTIPAGVPGAEGKAFVQGHATEAGPSGNIAAGDLAGACCRNNVFASNDAFTGGANARTYKAVAAQDIASASSIKTTLLASIKAAQQGQLNGATLLASNCTVTSSSDHRTGEEASQVTVTVHANCQGVAYSSEEATQIAQALQQTGYAVQGEPTIQVVSTTLKTARIKASAFLTYTWTLKGLDALAIRIAGMKKAQASAFLLQQTGIATVIVSVSGKDPTTIPADASRIQIVAVNFS